MIASTTCVVSTRYPRRRLAASAAAVVRIAKIVRSRPRSAQARTAIVMLAAGAVGDVVDAGPHPDGAHRQRERERARGDVLPAPPPRQDRDDADGRGGASSCPSAARGALAVRQHLGALAALGAPGAVPVAGVP